MVLHQVTALQPPAKGSQISLCIFLSVRTKVGDWEEVEAPAQARLGMAGKIRSSQLVPAWAWATHGGEAKLAEGTAWAEVGRAETSRWL